jgi:hypothetical protein
VAPPKPDLKPPVINKPEVKVPVISGKRRAHQVLVQVALARKRLILNLQYLLLNLQLLTSQK